MAFSAAVLVSSTTIVSVKRCFFASRSSPSSLVTFADAPEEDDEGSSLSFFLFLLFLLLLFFLFLLREMPPLSLRDPFTEFVASMFSLKSGNPWRNCTNIIWRGSTDIQTYYFFFFFFIFGVWKVQNLENYFFCEENTIIPN